MQISISTRHGELSRTKQEKIEAKVTKLSRIFERLTSIEVTVDLEDEDAPRVDMRVSAEHKHDFVAHDQSSNLTASVDSVIHKLEQQLRKYKEKVQERNRSPAASREGLPAEPRIDQE